jgi:hypothetical protein
MKSRPVRRLPLQPAAPGRARGVARRRPGVEKDDTPPPERHASDTNQVRRDWPLNDVGRPTFGTGKPVILCPRGDTLHTHTAVEGGELSGWATRASRPVLRDGASSQSRSSGAPRSVDDGLEDGDLGLASAKEAETTTVPVRYMRLCVDRLLLPVARDSANRPNGLQEAVLRRDGAGPDDPRKPTPESCGITFVRPQPEVPVARWRAVSTPRGGAVPGTPSRPADSRH